MIEIIVEFILVLAFISLQALFAFSEMTIISTNKIKLIRKSKENNRNANIILNFLKKPETLFGTTLVGISLCTVSSSEIASYIFSKRLNLPQSMQTIITTLIISPLILFFGEIMPMSLGREFAETSPYKIAQFMRFADIILRPLVFISTRLSIIAGKIFKVSQMKSSYVSKEEIKHLINEMHYDEPKKEFKKNMLKEVIDFSETCAKEIMIPLIETNLISTEFSKQHILELFNSTKRDKIPVYKDRVDNIIGILDITDFWLNINNDNIEEYLSKPYYVPESKTLDDLLKELQENGRVTAIVVDEFGGAEGIIYFDNIVSEIVNELKTLGKNQPKKMIKKINENTFELNGNVRIDVVNKKLNLNLPETYSTINGFITNELGRIPQINETFNFENYNFIILKSSEKKIEIVKFIINDKKNELNL